jgi:hypothetical protein
MAYDPSRQAVLLFGGRDAHETSLSDFWSWDGTRWTRLVTPTPSRRHSHAMVTDAARGRVVLFGGYQANPLSDTWEWDGTRWQLLVGLAASPSPRSSHGLAYDRARARVVLFGELWYLSGEGTWLLGPTVAAAHQPYGSGCGSGTRIPTLTTYGEPALGNSRFSLDLSSSPERSPFQILVSASAANLPLGGCSVLVDPNVLLSMSGTTNDTGFAAAPLAIPRDPGLLGLTVHAQAVVLDPAAPFLLALSQGLKLRLGE